MLDKPLLCIAHRGGSQQHSENTLAAFAESLELGVDAVELDVWHLGDELLVTHDRRLGKTLPGEGRLIEHHPQHLKELVLACGNRLATLPEVLQLLGEQVLINIELKGPDCARPVAQLLESHSRDHQWGFDHYVVSSFDHRQLFDFKQRLPQVKRGALIQGIPLDYAACASALEAYSLHPNIDFINAELVADAHRRGLQVWVYTVNEADDMHSMAELGVDGIFTDYPGRLLQLNREAQLPQAVADR